MNSIKTLYNDIITMALKRGMSEQELKKLLESFQQDNQAFQRLKERNPPAPTS